MNEIIQTKQFTSKKDLLKVVHINSQSLLAHMDEIKLLVDEECADVLCISETWLLPIIEDRLINIPNYNIFRQDLGRGGGVCIYVKQNLSAHRLDINVQKVDKVEDLWILVQSHKFPSIIIGTIYRHPHALVETFEYILDIFKDICMQNKYFFYIR